MNKSELIEALKKYVLDIVDVEKYKGKKIINGCDINEVLIALERDVIESLENKDKIEVHW